MPPAPPAPAGPEPAETPADPTPPLVDLSEIVSDWFAVNRKPEDVFSREALVAWAHEHGYCTKEEIVTAIVSSLTTKLP